VENAGEAIVIAQDGMMKFVNRMASEITGYSEQELLSMPLLEFIHPDDREMVGERYLKRLKGEVSVLKYAFRLIDKDGSIKWVEINAVLVTWEGKPATLNFLSDITERTQAEAMIQVSLREKEALLREIHHRVKNNMQVISSLFNLQAGHTLDEGCRTILKEAQTRIRSMSLVHEKLYQSRDLSKIDLGAYIQSLADHLFHFYLVDPAQVRLDTECEEVALDINSAIPCGLILNELTSNALK
jgi:PAS domain S-box-containing protein